MSIAIELGRGVFIFIRQPTRGDTTSRMSRWQLIVRKRTGSATIEFERLPVAGIPESKWLSELLNAQNIMNYWDEIAELFDLLREYYPDGRTMLKGLEELNRRRKR